MRVIAVLILVIGFVVGVAVARAHEDEGDPREHNGNPGCGPGQPNDDVCVDSDTIDADGDLPVGGVVVGKGGEDPTTDGYAFFDGDGGNEEYSGSLAGYIGLNPRNSDGETGPLVGSFEDGREHFHRDGGGNAAFDAERFVDNLGPRM